MSREEIIRVGPPYGDEETEAEAQARIENEVREYVARRETPEYKLAAKIAADLFTNGFGQHARRLVLELDDRGLNGGGWSELAVTNRIADRLLAARPSSDAPRPSGAAQTETKP